MLGESTDWESLARDWQLKQLEGGQTSIFFKHQVKVARSAGK
jgi:hypothetical protein